MREADTAFGRGQCFVERFLDAEFARAGVFFPMPETKILDAALCSRHRAALVCALDSLVAGQRERLGDRRGRDLDRRAGP